MDFNKDRSVSAKEMQRWIMEKTEEHFQEAMLENKNSFRAVDPDGDGERNNSTRRGRQIASLMDLDRLVSRFFLRRSCDMG